MSGLRCASDVGLPTNSRLTESHRSAFGARRNRPQSGSDPRVPRVSLVRPVGASRADSFLPVHAEPLRFWPKGPQGQPGSGPGAPKANRCAPGGHRAKTNWPKAPQGWHRKPWLARNRDRPRTRRAARRRLRNRRRAVAHAPVSRVRDDDVGVGADSDRGGRWRSSARESGDGADDESAGGADCQDGGDEDGTPNRMMTSMRQPRRAACELVLAASPGTADRADHPQSSADYRK